MEYQELLNFIGDTKKFGKKLGLSKLRRLMERLGNPQDSLRFVHIAGTNGKGSTAAFLSEIFISAGYRTGLFTSPFLYVFNERMRINGELIGDKTLCAVTERVKKAADWLQEQGDEYPTEFELVTAIAFCYFADEKCDIVILEVGLGGRLDATNIIKTPELSVITSIGLDHTQWLGNSVAEIAFEKCGILKENGKCVCYGLQPPEAYEVIEKSAREQNNLFITWKKQELSECTVSADGNQFTFQGRRYRSKMRGEYQIYNAATAICSAEVLAQSGWKISHSQIEAGIANTCWRGRMETLCRDPLIIAEGAHNPDGMRAFVKSARQIAGEKKIVCLFAMLKDKDYKSSLSELSALTENVIFTTLAHPRAADINELACAAKDFFSEIDAVYDCRRAIKLAASRAGKNGVVFILGSLYLIGEVKKALEG